ncbi:MAG: hypothetical protein WCJ87_05850 [Burkholderiales bacterium]
MTTRPAHDAEGALSHPPGEQGAPTGPDPLHARVERESGMVPSHASPYMWMRAAAHASRAQLAERMNRSLREDRRSEAKRVHYLSMEFLMGRALGNALAALGLHGDFETAARASGKQPGHPRGRTRCSAGQWWPGATGGLLPRFAGHPGCALFRVRPALPLRDVCAAHL